MKLRFAWYRICVVSRCPLNRSQSLMVRIRHNIFRVQIVLLTFSVDLKDISLMSEGKGVICV